MKTKAGKSLILIGLICGVLTSNVNAITIDSIKSDAGTITVKGTSSDERVSYKIYKLPGTAISDIYDMGETIVENGGFSFNLEMPESVLADGDFTVDVHDSLATSSQNVKFSAYSYMVAFINKVNQKTTGDDLYNLFKAKSDDNVYFNYEIMYNLGVEQSYYETLDDDGKREIAANIATEKAAFLASTNKSALEIEDFSEVYDKAQKVHYINNHLIDTDWLGATSLKADIDDKGFISNDIIERLKNYVNLDYESRKNWIVSVLGDGTRYNSYAEIENRYKEANALYILNRARSGDYDMLIDEYNDEINIKGTEYYTKYLNGTDQWKSNVNIALQQSISRLQPKTAEGFRNAYKTAIQTTPITNSNVGSTVGGATGGGGVSSEGVGLVLPEKTNPTAVVSGFSDLGSVGWAQTAITALANEGIISGYGDKTFKPQQSIKREEFVKMVIAAAHIDLNKPACEFGDVEQDKWYAQYVNAAYGAGIISGTSDTDFGIGRGITREDMAVIIARLLNLENAETENVFADDADISGYAKEAIYKLYAAGKIAGVGDNTFAPKEIVTRAQAAKIIYDTLVSGN